MLFFYKRILFKNIIAIFKILLFCFILIFLFFNYEVGNTIIIDFLVAVIFFLFFEHYLSYISKFLIVPSYRMKLAQFICSLIIILFLILLYSYIKVNLLVILSLYSVFYLFKDIIVSNIALRKNLLKNKLIIEKNFLHSGFIKKRKFLVGKKFILFNDFDVINLADFTKEQSPIYISENILVYNNCIVTSSKDIIKLNNIILGYSKIGLDRVKRVGTSRDLSIKKDYYLVTEKAGVKKINLWSVGDNNDDFDMDEFLKSKGIRVGITVDNIKFLEQKYNISLDYVRNTIIV